MTFGKMKKMGSLQTFIRSTVHCNYKNNFNTAWKVSKYGVISGLYFRIFGLNTGKYGPEITRYLDTFHAVQTMVERIHWQK